jgi:hypothetical protein
MRVAGGVLGLIGVAVVAFAAPPAAPPIPRAELESLQASVEAAVTSVSRPAGLMFGRPSRAYHLKGYGAIVVLAPRALPRVRRHDTGGAEARAFADLLGRLQQSIATVNDPEERRHLEETLAALRIGLPPGRPLVMRAPRPRLAAPPADMESLQQEAEAFRREAERAMEKAEREVLLRLSVPEDGHPFALLSPPDVPEAPEPPEAPQPAEAPAAPPAPPTPVVPATRPAPVVPPVLPAPPAPAAPVALPGWPFWFGDVDAEDAPPDRVLADVRRAIVAGLGAYRGGLALLGPDEFVVVAVDFVPRMADRARSRTVVARARKRDLVAHRAGRLSADALDAKIEFDEY